ncbi:hypothetical protein B9G98_03976 [Wickerhamiella sorbophila]|uniref:Uncharacterized protein n=1 Tax=Wickerhamiella sorbophila TaxID=45607 RepID=A0A2T0FMZ2_9ASCO|nr:hypothetical protein B9G98_03976 [Wickerhamiella sorbophila]PRT56356.1 hypothetical protein B9G98_03976 [Wickerhamiella sorbophila]
MAFDFDRFLVKEQAARKIGAAAVKVATFQFYPSISCWWGKAYNQDQVGWGQASLDPATSKTTQVNLNVL